MASTAVNGLTYIVVGTLLPLIIAVVSDANNASVIVCLSSQVFFGRIDF